MKLSHIAASLVAAPLTGALLLSGAGCSRTPCEGMGTGKADPRFADLLPAGADVCGSVGSSKDTQFEVKGGYGDVFGATVEKLAAKGYADDLNPLAPPVRESGHVVRNYRSGFSGLRVTAMDRDGYTWVHLVPYAACPISEALDGDTLEDSVRVVLAGGDDGFTCQSLRSLVPDPDHLPLSIERLEGFVDAYRPIAEDPKELLALFAAARAEGRKEIVVKEPKTFEDPAFEGRRGALKALFPSPPAIVTIGGKPLGLFGRPDRSGGSDEDAKYVRFMWVTALDALHVVEPPPEAKSGKKKKAG